MIREFFCKRMKLFQYNLQVEKAIRSGVSPLGLYFIEVGRSENRTPMAYRGITFVNSTVLGKLTPREYSYDVDASDVGLQMAEWNVKEAMRQINRFVEAGRHIEWISVKCPVATVERVDMYDWMKDLIEKNKFRYPEKLCLEFENSLLKQKTAKARLAVLDMKLLGVKTMLTGCASSQSPFAKITEIPVDYVLLSKEATVWAGSRNKPTVFPSLVSYLQSMGTKVYAEGIENDHQLEALNRAEVEGYTVTRSYHGRAKTKWKYLSPNIARKQNDSEDWDE